MLRKKYEMFSTPRGRAVTPLIEGEHVVENNLAYTPADMQRMAAKGVSINSQNMEGSYYYEAQTKEWNLSIADQRGIDPADIWNAQMSARDKLRSAHRRVREKKQSSE